MHVLYGNVQGYVTKQFCLFNPILLVGAGIAQWYKHQTWLTAWLNWQVTGSNPGRSGGRIVFSRVNFLCWLILVSIPSPCYCSSTYKCRWQATAKHACIHVNTLHLWLRMKCQCKPDAWSTDWLVSMAHTELRNMCQEGSRFTWHFLNIPQKANVYTAHWTCAEMAAVLYVATPVVSS